MPRDLVILLLRSIMAATMTLLSFLATMVISSRRNKTPLLHIQDFTLVIVYGGCPA